MNEHPDRNEVADPQEERELRAVAALLRGLPDPEPPEELCGRVMQEVRRRESGPRKLLVALQRIEPVVATGLAAGIGALLLTTAIQNGLSPLEADAPPSLQPSEARRVTHARIAAAPARPSAVPIPVALPGVGGRSAHLLGVSPPAALGSGRLGSAGNPVDLGLDRQINRLLLDPDEFFARLEQMNEPDRFVARLADRAVRRGDAVEVALRLRLRSPDHPQTAVLVDRLLRAAIAREVPGPR